MTHPLIWIFAIAGCLLAAWFLFAAWLAYRHARERARHAEKLTGYIIDSGARMRGMQASEVSETRVQRAKVMHVTIGDLVRDDRLVTAAANGIATRRIAIKRHAASSREPAAANPAFVLKRNVQGRFYFNLIAPDGTVIATSESYESKAAALNGIASVMTNAPEASIEEQV